jgi:ElaA protein
VIVWQWSTYSDLSKDDLYEILKVRQDVFVVEQNCVYQDVDDLDDKSWHLIAWDMNNSGGKNIVAYLRVVLPGYKYKEPSMGRVLTIQQARYTGLGKQLIKEALINIEVVFPNQPIRISSQEYLIKFYNSFGFTVVSEPYDEDGISHIEMLKR